MEKGFLSELKDWARDSNRDTEWNDINIPTASMASAGATILDVVTVGSNNLKGFVGTGAVVQQADGSIELLHDYKEGTDIRPHIHWMPNDTGAGNVKFSLGYRWFNRADVMPAETVITVTQSAGGVQYQHNTAVFTTITGTGKGIGSRFVFRLFRDPADVADTYANHALTLDFGIHYQCDSQGSCQVLIK